MSATLDEFLLAAEYILDRGNADVMLCERGIRTYEDHTRFTLPLATVPYLNDKSHLPVVVDPSHGTGKSKLVMPMSKAAVAAGADALIIEVHDDPEHAVSDGAQTITPAAFGQLMQQMSPDRRSCGPDHVIASGCSLRECALILELLLRGLAWLMASRGSILRVSEPGFPFEPPSSSCPPLPGRP